MGSAPRAPAGLGTAGRNLWREVLAEFEVPPDGQVLLVQAARTLDELERLREALAAAGVMSTGSAGQPVASPLLGEIRAHRALLGKLLEQIALPDQDDQPAPTAVQRQASDRARKAAQTRWAMHRQRYGDGASTA
ncbi:MAG: hypothetical protein ACRDSL_03040 [Pseudonocardiaceae bacterium]